ncbi:glutathione S-transferase 4-like [Dermacentor variabilis]|uniref:glutathione S-transferase 4-like n=1 Tax=Dermacentor variabilis TaxID=34621 RepID=UPI003F5C64CB
MTITLYNINGSPPGNLVRALAKHLGIELKLKNLDAANKEHLSDEYLKVNPFHKVPAIDDEGFIVYESNAIVYYLLRKYAPESELYPASIKTRTRIDQILSAVVTTIQPKSDSFVRDMFSPLLRLSSRPNEDHFARCCYHVAYTSILTASRPLISRKTKPTAEEIAALEENIVRALEHLIGDGKFAAGDTFTIADMALAGRLPVALENNIVNPSKFPKLASYYDRVKREQPYFEEIYKPAIDRFKGLMDDLK